MQSEEFDNKIREAAEHHHPEYDEKAWGKMEKLLDKHLPQEKDDRRRIIFLLLLFLVLGGSSAWLLISKPWEKAKYSVQAKKKDTGQSNSTISSTTTTTDKNKNTTGQFNKADKGRTNDEVAAESNRQISATPVVKEYGTATVTDFNEKQKKTNTFSIAPVNKRRDNENNLTVSKMADKNVLHNDKKTEKSQQERITGDDTKIVVANSVVANNPDNNLVEQVVNKNVAISKNFEEYSKGPDNTKAVSIKNEPLTQTPAAKKANNKKNNSFFFTLSAGPDVSTAGSDRLGKLKLLAGAGLGYTFKNRFTIRTGFYTGRKIYTASPDEYHPPADFRTYYPYLEKVDANCKVFEIPLLLSYTFGKSSKQNWFASAGLSSYLMKKETYNYFYKQTVWGQTLNRKWIIENQNKHYFSVFTLSGGYQRSVSKNVFVTIEPYIKLPLSGVGYGKVKLNSGGFLFSIGIQPFHASKKQKR